MEDALDFAVSCAVPIRNLSEFADAELGVKIDFEEASTLFACFKKLKGAAFGKLLGIVQDDRFAKVPRDVCEVLFAKINTDAIGCMLFAEVSRQLEPARVVTKFTCSDRIS